MKVKDYYTRWEALKAERQSFMDSWRDLSEYCMAYRARFLTDANNKGDESRLTKTQYNNKARIALRTIAAGMQAGITSPSRPWFKMQVAEGVEENEEVKQWIARAQSTMYEVFSASNFYNAVHTMYSELACFGTAAVGCFENFDDVVDFKTFGIGSYAFSTDDAGNVTGFYREFRMTVGQLVDKFGYDNCSRTVRTHYDKRQLDQWYKVIHAVEKNSKPDAKGFAKGMAFISVYFETASKDHEGFLRESGFDEMPFAVARWDIGADDIYATDCPGMIALGDMKALQLGELKKYQALDKIVNPPMIGDAALKQAAGKKALQPGTITWAGEAMAGMKSVYENYRPDLGAMMEINREAETRISKAFYEDLFLMLANSDRRQITATEIAEKQEEKLLQLGPVLERLHSEFLDKLIDRVFAVVLRSGILPPPPEALQGEQLQVNYVSILAQAQKMVNIGSIERISNFAGQIAAMYPEAMMKLDPLELITVYAESLGVDPSVLRSNDQVQQMIAAQQQAAQQQAAMEQSQQMIQTAKTAGEVDQTNIQQLMKNAGLT